MVSEATAQALAILRDPSQFKWYVIPLLLLVLYVYMSEVEKENWSAVLAGLAFWGMDWINEIWNGLVFHFTQFAPVWGAPDHGTAYLILIGLNIEISFMFATLGIVSTKLLIKEKGEKILGLPNRLVTAMGGATLCVIVEIFLNKAGALTWEYPLWNSSAPWLIFLIGYLPFFLMAYWVYDMESRKKQIMAVGTIWAIVLSCLTLFVGVLGWI